MISFETIRSDLHETKISVQQTECRMPDFIFPDSDKLINYLSHC